MLPFAVDWASKTLQIYLSAVMAFDGQGLIIMLASATLPQLAFLALGGGCGVVVGGWMTGISRGENSLIGLFFLKCTRDTKLQR